MDIPTRYITVEAGWGLLALTIALCGAAVIPRWNPEIEYCVPHSECRIVKAVDPGLFQWHQEQAHIVAKRLKAQSKKRHWLEDTADETVSDLSEFAVGVQNTFAPQSSKEFLRLTAEARRKGWRLQMVQALPGYGNGRKVAGGFALLAAAASAWFVGQLEILQQQRDRREEIEEEFALNRHRRALEGEHAVITAEIDWVSATEQKALEAEYLGEDYEDFIEEQTRELDDHINRQEKAMNQLPGSQTLDSINNPGDKVQGGQKQEAITDSGKAPDAAPTPTWLKGFLSSTCLVWGNQGSGKSWFVRLLALRKKQMGYKVIVFDPNSNRSEWLGGTLYNTYDQIETQMQWYVEEVMGRYESFGKTEISEQEWRKNLWQQGKAVTLICEEMTTYADFIADKELLTKFVKVATTLSRKQEMPVTFVTHNNTQSCMGDIKGLANLVGRMQQIQLLASTDPHTSQPVASGKALIKLDGSDAWMEVVTPKLDKKIKDFREESEKIGDSRDYIERAWQLEFDLKDTPHAPPTLSAIAAVLWEIIKSASRYPISFDAIRKSRRWGEKQPEKHILKEGLAELISVEKIEGSEEEGYTPIG